VLSAPDAAAAKARLPLHGEGQAPEVIAAPFRLVVGREHRGLLAVEELLEDLLRRGRRGRCR